MRRARSMHVLCCVPFMIMIRESMLDGTCASQNTHTRVALIMHACGAFLMVNESILNVHCVDVCECNTRMCCGRVWSVRVPATVLFYHGTAAGTLAHLPAVICMPATLPYPSWTELRTDSGDVYYCNYGMEWCWIWAAGCGGVLVCG